MSFSRAFVGLLSLAGGVLASPASAPVYGAPPSYGNRTIAPNPKNGHWVDTWTAMPQLTEYTNLPPPPFVGIPKNLNLDED